MLRKIKNWFIERKERKYQEIIRRYSSKDQELIMSGREIEKTCYTLEELRKNGIELKVINKRSGPIRENSRIINVMVPYFRASIFGEDYESNVRYWRDIGRLEADILFSCRIAGPDFVNYAVGIPGKVLRTNTNCDK